VCVCACRARVHLALRLRDVICNKYTFDSVVTKKPLDYLCDAVSARKLRRLPLKSSFAHEFADPRCESITSEIGSCIDTRESWVTERILYSQSTVPRNVEIALPETNCHVFVRRLRSFLPLADASVEHLLNYRAQ